MKQLRRSEINVVFTSVATSDTKHQLSDRVQMLGCMIGKVGSFFRREDAFDCEPAFEPVTTIMGQR
jgi:hypothetical protein